MYGVIKTCSTPMTGKLAYDQCEPTIIAFYGRRGKWASFDDISRISDDILQIEE